MCSTFTRTEDFSCSQGWIRPRDRAETFLYWDGLRLILYLIFFAVPVMGDSIIALFSAEVAAIRRRQLLLSLPATPEPLPRRVLSQLSLLQNEPVRDPYLRRYAMRLTAELSCISLSDGMRIRISFPVLISGE